MRFQEFSTHQTKHTLDNPGTWSKPIPLDQMIRMLKGTATEAQAAPSIKGMPSARYCDPLLETLARHPSIKGKLGLFLESKLKNHMAEFGSRDAHFSGSGNFVGKKHAHLTHDISIIYSVHGNPPTIDLYGVFRHDESGTGMPANLKRQKSLAKRMAGQTFEPVDQNKFSENS